MTDATDPTMTGEPFRLRLEVDVVLDLAALGVLARELGGPDEADPGAALRTLLGGLTVNAADRAEAAIVAPLTDAGVDLYHLAGYAATTSVAMTSTLTMTAGSPATPDA